MSLELEDYQITINGLVSSCHCKYNHCLMCSGDGKIMALPFEKLKQLALGARKKRTARAARAEPLAYYGYV